MAKANIAREILMKLGVSSPQRALWLLGSGRYPIPKSITRPELLEISEYADKEQDSNGAYAIGFGAAFTLFQYATDGCAFTGEHVMMIPSLITGGLSCAHTYFWYQSRNAFRNVRKKIDAE